MHTAISSYRSVLFAYAGPFVVALMSSVSCSTAYEVKQRLGLRSKVPFDCGSLAVEDRKSCKPHGGKWDKVLNVPSYNVGRSVDAGVSVNNIDGRTFVQMKIAEYYLGRPYYCLNGACSIDPSCPPIQNIDRDSIVTHTQPVSTSLRELYAEKIKSRADATLKGEAKAKQISLSTKARLDFKAELEKQLKSQSSGRFVYYQSTLAAPSTNAASVECRNIARTNDGSIVSGVAGIVIADLKRDAEFTTASMIDLALEAAAETDQNLRALGSGEGWVKFHRKSQKMLETSIRSEVDGMAFFPLWIQFRNPGVLTPPPFDLSGTSVRTKEQPCKRVYSGGIPLFLEFEDRFEIRCELEPGSYEIRVAGKPGALCGSHPCSTAAGKWKLDWAFFVCDQENGCYPIRTMPDVARDDADSVGWHDSFHVKSPQIVTIAFENRRNGSRLYIGDGFTIEATVK